MLVIGINHKYKNRGKTFENLVEYTNIQYKMKGWALVNQVPTPTKNIKGRIIYEKKSTVDFIGITHGRAIGFDAKSTRQTTRFDLKNIHKHQVEYLNKFQEQGGIAFFLVHFEKKKETFFVPFDFIKERYEAWEKGGKASIPYNDIFYECPQVHSENGILLHYLKHCS